MGDQEPIIVLKPQFFLPRNLRRRMNYFWAFKQPKNAAIEMKIRKMKRNIICRANNCAADVYDHWMGFVQHKQYLLPELKSLEAIKEQIQAGIFRPHKLRNAIYSRMLEEAAEGQFVAAEEEAAAQQFMEETVVAAERANQAARAAVAAAERAKQAATAAVATKEATAAARFANEAVEAAQVAEVAADTALLAKRTKETYENAKVARKADIAAEFAKKIAEAVRPAEDTEMTLEATPDEAVIEGKLGKLMISEDYCGGGECKRDDCDCKKITRGARGVMKKLDFCN